LTPEKIKKTHGSFPVNPLLAEPLYLTKYIERIGTGIQDMIEQCKKHGLHEPEFSVSDGVRIIIRRSTENDELKPRPESRPESLENMVLNILQEKPLSKAEIADRLGHKSISRGLKTVIIRLVAENFIEYILPEKPNSRLQKYRIKR
jgi:predicted HTH transcriptional regulator